MNILLFLVMLKLNTIPHDVEATVLLMDAGHDVSERRLSELSQWMEDHPKAWNRYCRK